MSLQPFNKTSRKDGRSDGQVVFDLVLNMKPNDILTYETLLEELQKDIDTVEFDRNRVYGAVKSANKKLLKKQSRYLAVIRGQGYKLITADEHLGVALNKKQTAQKYMKTGVEILEYTQFEELSPSHRIVHEQQMILMKGLYHKIKHHDQRIGETENLLDKMRNDQLAMIERLNKLEKQ